MAPNGLQVFEPFLSLLEGTEFEKVPIAQKTGTSSTEFESLEQPKLALSRDTFFAQDDCGWEWDGDSDSVILSPSSSPLSSPRAVGVKKSDFHFCAPANLRDHPSAGSELHSQGKCKPCIWFWTSQGCQDGRNCQHCHICPRQRQVKQDGNCLHHNSSQRDHCHKSLSFGTSTKDRVKKSMIITAGSRLDRLEELPSLLKRKLSPMLWQRSPSEEAQRSHRLERFALQLQAQQARGVP